MRAVAAAVVALALAGPAAAAPPFKATLTAGTGTPKVNVKWYYTVRVTDLAGTGIRAKITVRIADPFGGVHPVEFGTSKRPIVDWPVVGVFRDFIRFPPESRGFGLTVRVLVKAMGGRLALDYKVTPQ